MGLRATAGRLLATFAVPERLTTLTMSAFASILLVRMIGHDCCLVRMRQKVGSGHTSNIGSFATT